MAKDKDLDFDDDFDDFDFGSDGDFDTPPQPDDRKPITKVATSFLGGVADEFTNPTTVKRLTLDALPDGYSKADNLLGEVAGAGRDLYNTTITELKPVINDAKRVARRALPGVKNFLPEKLAKKLEEMTAAEDSGVSAQQSREAAVQSEVASIFGAVAEQDQEDRIVDKAEKAREKVEDRKKFKLEIDALSSIHQGISRLVTYQDQITSKYQRKVLELSYLQYYTLKDTFELHRASTREQKTLLDVIAKNTGLPEYQKTTLGEAAGQQFRDRLLTATQARVKDVAGKYFGKYKDNLIKNAKGHLSNFKESAMGALTGAEMAIDVQEQMADMGEQADPYKTGGRMAGSVAGNWVGTKIAKLLKPILGDMDKVKKGGAALEYGVDNLPGLVEQWAKSDKGENSKFQWANKAMRWLKDQAPSEIDDPLLDSKKETDLTKSNDAVAFSHAARKSLTDIIPGFLSRIHHELAIIRTGDSSIARVEYDLRDGSFRDSGSITKNLVGSLFSQDNFKKTHEATDTLISDLTGGDASKLSPAAQKALKRRMISEASRLSGHYDAKKFYDVDGWDDSSLSDEDRIALSDLFLESKDDIVKQNAQSKKFHNIRDYLNNPAEAIKALSMQAGGLEHMRRAGLVTGENEDRQVNFDRITDMLVQGGIGDKFDQTGGDPRVASSLFGPVGPGGGNSGGGLNPTHANQSSRPRSAAEVKAKVEECVCGDEFDRLIQAVKEGNDRLVAEITKSHTQNAQQAEQIALLAGIYEYMQSGQMMVFSVDGTQMFKSLKDRMAGKFKGLGSRIKGLKDNRLVKGAGNLFGMAKTGVVNTLKSPLWAANKVKDGLKHVWDKISGKFNDIKELYVRGEFAAKLTKAKLEAGEYIDAKTGKVIQKWEDIKGPVKDRAGEMVLTAEDFAKGLWTNHGKPWKESFTKRLGNAWYNTKRILKSPVSLVKGLLGGAKKFGESLRDAFNKPRDIYIPGREEPIILASVMKAGGYKNADGSVISKWTDIKGAVYDLEGNVVVTLEMLTKGMMDSAGQKLELARGLLGTAVDKAKKYGGMAIDGAKKLGRGAMSLAKGIGGFMKGGLKGIGGKLGLGKGGSSEMMEVIGEYQILLLEEIRDGVRDLKPKRIKGDLSGDGLRDGSWEAITAKRQAARDAKNKDKPEPKEKKEKKGGLMGLLMSAVGLLAGIPAALNNGITKLGQILAQKAMIRGAADALSGGIDAPDGKKKGGRLGRLGKAVGRGAGIAARGIGTVAMMGGSGLLTAAGTALGGLASGAAAVGGAVLSVLSAPVVLGAAAVAAVGFGAWWLYKRHKKNQRGGLLKLRMAQYGFAIDDHDNVDKLLAFEDLVKPAVKTRGADPLIDFQMLDVDKIREMFNIGKDDPEGFQRFAKWCDARFTPVYLAHDAATKKFSPNGKMDENDEKLSVEDKLKYLEVVKLPDDRAYEALDHPMQDGRLTMTTDEIVSIFKELKVEYEKGVAETKAAEAAATGSAAAAAAVGATTEEPGKLAKALGAVKDTALKILKFTPIGIMGSMAVKAAEKIVGLGKSMFEWIKGKFFTEEFKVPSILNREIDPLTSIRYRLYGLSVMEYAKAGPISKLEEQLIKDVNYSGKGQAKWDGDAKSLFKQVGGLFVTNTDSEETLKMWCEWFSKRFLPVFLSFLTAVRGFAKNGNPFEAYERFAAPQVLEIARFMAQAVSNPDAKPENRLSVWSIADIPFDRHEPNMDPSTIAPFMTLLEEDARTAILNEKQNANKGTTGAPTPGQTTKAQVSLAAARSVGNPNATYATPLQKAMYGSMPVSTEVGKTGGGMRVASMEAQGGLWTNLPGVAGPDGEWSSYKDLILAASQMAGVDPGLMAVMAGVESTFRGRAQAAQGSAKGLYQFMPGTWKDMLRKYGKKYGLTEDADVLDPRANALMGAEYLKENSKGIKQAYGRDATDIDLYLSHFFGPTGVKKFLEANPNEIAAKVLPAAAKQNEGIFFSKDGKARTIAQVHAEVDARMSNWRNTAGQDARASAGLGRLETVASAPVIPGVTSPTSMGTNAPAQSTIGTMMTVPGASAPAANTTGPIGVLKPNQGTSVPGPTGSYSGGPKPVNPSVTATQAKDAGQAMLMRETSQEDGTYGILTLPDGSTFNTLELPWRNNETGKSCIPPGTYKVEMRDSPKFGPCYEVKGVPNRSAILIHAGNTAGNVDKGLKSDVQGCILLGLGRGRVNNQSAVIESKAAMASFMQKMSGRSFTLNVVGSAQDTASTPVPVSTEAQVTPSVLAPVGPDTTPVASPLVNKLVGPTSAQPVGNAPGAALNATMELPNLLAPPTPANVTPEAVVEQQQRVAQRAANTQRQSTEVSKQTEANTAAVEALMKQQLEIQMSMDASLKNIDAGIQQMAQHLATGQQASEPTNPAKSAPTAAKRAQATPATLTPINFRRRVS